MKVSLAVLAFALVGFNAGATEIRMTGKAAVELYAALNIPEVPVSDEHGGPVYATAKYGQFIGCVKMNDGSNTECWVNQ